MDASVLIVVGGTVIGALALVGVAAYGVRRRSDAKTGDVELIQRLDERLAETHDETRTHLEHPPKVRSLAVVDERDKEAIDEDVEAIGVDGEAIDVVGETNGGDDETNDGDDEANGADGHPTHVPVIRVDLGTTDAPGLDIVFEYVASVLEAVHPLLVNEGVPVHHYDVQFTFGPGGLVVSGECRRVAVPPELAKRLVSDDRYRPHHLRRDVTAGDDGDDATVPVAWGECVTYDDS